ncbi:Gfo/Idh/MocA family oxidoreductase [Porphyrobacter sp. YT40]|uniref:Gfo/Idh/MocA family protein n=1 Tax=Porphyrobacter sp. YT40 TaxID=2547601 RepID=UPI0011446771|nr:Gfo/Idh/MocA family oxidoreductase [Porphyrobacter sp. YT40]QDH34271.1 Gfo/Idh/MocA family oxidoreductase [Porphyrobacter sp. YT40]
MTIRIAIVGLGKIASDRHIPAIDGDAGFVLAATVDPTAQPRDGVPHFGDLASLLDSDIAIDAVAICTPPQARYDLAHMALGAGKHVLVEKPPAATVTAAQALAATAQESGAVLFAAWHSRYAHGVAPAREWLQGRTILGVAIDWREDVRVWHPGQDWIFAPGGFGVFDPGINALSIATRILPRPLMVEGGHLAVPENRAAPIAGNVRMLDTAGVPVTVTLDFLQEGPQTWYITIDTDEGRLTLSQGGRILRTPDGESEGDDREYAEIYAAFAKAVAAGRSDADLTPLQLVADAFMRCRSVVAPPFDG